ncbi:hypothetical protein H2200_000142 [Cladophialophora chaetospira]|uniref:F-box domain-containing protein n=1 Tax=Cladophialophora chaetospira TaxID=386627 RepID=A0AA38XNX6_9EURO|nr:hypothetical protein H2200_000142 [Cladophialophora chaetospira]
MDHSDTPFKAGGSNGVPPGTSNSIKPARNPQSRQQAQRRQNVQLAPWKHPTTRHTGRLSFLDLPPAVRKQIYLCFFQLAPKFLNERTQEGAKISRTRQSLLKVSKAINKEWTPIFYATKPTHSFQAWGGLYTPHYLEQYRLTRLVPEKKPIDLTLRAPVQMWLDNLRQIYYEFETYRVDENSWEFSHGGADHLASFLFRHKPASLREVVLSTQVAPNSTRFHYDVGRMSVTHRVWKDLWKKTSDGKEGGGWAVVQRRFQVCAGKNALEDWHVMRRLRYQTEKQYREVDAETIVEVNLVVKSAQLVFRKNGRPLRAVANYWVEFE